MPTETPILHYWLCLCCAHLWQHFDPEEYCGVCGDDRLAKYELDRAQDAQNDRDELRWSQAHP